MRGLLTILMAVSLASACAVRTEQYYLPDDSRLAEEGKVCGSVPYGRAKVPLGQNLSASVSISPTEGRIGVAVQLALPPGAKVRLLNPELGIEVPGSGHTYTGRLEPFKATVYGRGGQPGHHEIVTPDTVLEGKGRNSSLASADSSYLQNDLYISHTLFNTSPLESLVLLFPAAEVNGVAIAPQRIQFKQVERTGLMTCVQ